jgi:predicted ATPase/class 3 adenylate cyclase
MGQLKLPLVPLIVSAMRPLPSGTVTFLFTDIERSTQLLHELGDRYAEVLAEHRRILRAAVAANGGVEVDTQGDAFLIAFQRASHAVSAASAAQQELGPGPVKVRMGIHTGEPVVTEEGYVGIDVHRAARVMAAGHGGQVLISSTTRDLLDGRYELRDLGAHRLKDLSAPQQLFQLGAADFPPLRTLHQTNLPVQPTPLVGRLSELERAGVLLRENRLVTLVGPGGSGKTRLALQLAAEAVEDFEDGVFWVPLQAVSDPALVEATIAQTLGTPDGLADFLRGRRTLLLLDNLEQLLDAASRLAGLLRETAGVKLLVTSREPLKLAGEQRFPVDPLPENDAVTLFVERALAVDPGFTPVPAVGEICRRLDGLPLALELAAARVSLLSVEDLLSRLDRALPLLTGGTRDVPERQRTLRATIAWSYELCSVEEQQLFGRLGIFPGSFTLDAAETVCEATLDTLQSLIDRSLVRRWESGRFGMLETIHEFARERLAESSEIDELSRRHAEHYLAVAESTNMTAGAEATQDPELVRLEKANFRAALHWAVAHPDVELSLRIAVALENHWVHADPFEGAHWLERLLADADGIDAKLRADAVRAHSGVIYIVGEFERGARLYVESLALYRALGDEWGEGHMLHRLAADAQRRGDLDRAIALAEEGLEINRRQRNRKEEAIGLGTLGGVAWKRGDGDEAIELLTRSAELAGETGFTWWEAATLLELGEIALETGRLSDAEPWLLKGVMLTHHLGDRLHLVYGLALLAQLAAQQGRLERAGRLWGALEAEERQGRIGQWESERGVYEQAVLAHAGPELEHGRAAGRLLSLGEAVEQALSSS